MKPIPAIDENGEFLRMPVWRGGPDYTIIAITDAGMHYWDTGCVFRYPRTDPEYAPASNYDAVRERVERARLNRVYGAALLQNAHPRKPSFAEALRLVVSRQPWNHTVQWHDISRAIDEARAASGE